ncbi:hypothetical protein F5141DRAFT_1105535 [Pisolithus sp. B1]|nr:hypothetical protein F5141DRAFT_1105535 [Pisolithus sp. B1]
MENLSEKARPAWQTEDLEEEWVEEDDASFGTQSISLTAPLPGFLHTPDSDKDDSDSSPVAGGTFLIRDDMPVTALPKTPGRQNKKGSGIKDIFSPLPLEKMFEPPSPPPPRPATLALTAAPAVPSRLSQAYTPDDSQSEAETAVLGNPPESDVLKPAPSSNLLAPPSPKLGINKSDTEYQFTFSAPHHGPMYPQAQSTPGHARSIANPPATDPRLRLFQLQYDTFTREHLSAMVDSIAVNTPSGGNSDGNGSPSSIVQQAILKNTQSSSDDTPVRSVKRVRLSAPSDIYGEGAGEGATIARPKVSRIDYVGESQSLMQQIRQARDFSTISTTVTAQSPASQPSQKPHTMTKRTSSMASNNKADVKDMLAPPTTVDGGRTAGSSPSTTVRSIQSSLAIRQQAEAFMQQIKNDMKGSKRLFSGDTEVSRDTHAEDAPESVADESHHSTWSATTRDKESRNRRKSLRLGSPRRPSASSRHSPRRPGRSESAEQNRSFVHEISNMSIEVPWQTDHTSAANKQEATSNPVHNIPDIRVTTSTVVSTTTMHLVPPANQLHRSYPSSTVHSGNNEDLNRFVSTSTASGTIVTASSAPSFVKHAGPVHITHITPLDVPSLPERIGKMVYDKEQMRWTKASIRAVSEADDHRDHSAGTDAESEDPFRDIDSLREDDSGGSYHSEQGAAEGHVDRNGNDEDEDQVAEIDISGLEEVGQEYANDQEEVDLTSFTFDGPSVAAIRMATSEEEEVEDDISDSDSDAHDEEVGDTEDRVAPPVFESEDEPSHDSPIPNPQPLPTERFNPTIETTPVVTARRSSALTTPMPSRPAMRSTSVTPVSAMKDPNRDRFRTPAQRIGHRRSVSFSDGKRDGPIRGLSTKPHESDDDIGTSMATSTTTSLDPSQSSSDCAPSARSRRLAEMMHMLEITEDSPGSPTRSSVSGRSSGHQLLPLGNRRPSSQMAVVNSSGTTRRMFSMSQKSNITEQDGRMNATFLTECSFGLAHDKLVQVITDVQPFEPYWEELHGIDLSRKSLESVARLKEFMPKLDSLTLNSNRLSWLSGIPGSVRTLSVASNLLTAVTSFSHLLNLENLDISHNDIDSLTQLQCLRHLRELRADGNKIISLEGLQKLDGLTKLSVQENLIREIDLSLYRWPRLEMLDLSQNRLSKLSGLAGSLPALIALNVDGNALEQIEPGGTMPRLRILRASNNRLQMLNVAPFGSVRTLYVDNNSLPGLVKGERLGKLENLSMRNQSCRDFHLPTRQFRDVKRLYLSGNKLKSDFIDEPCYNLIYLEVAACRLGELPHGLGRLVPNLRVLNLNYNFLEDVAGLEGLTRMNKLTLIGSRLKGTKPLIRVLQRMPELEMLDVRMNPCTLGWYLPLLVRDVPGALQPSESGEHGPGLRQQGGRGGDRGYGWQELDVKFRRDLPDEVYVGRLAYRGLVMRACPRMRMLDGVEVTEKERTKANHLLQGILSKQQKTIKGLKCKSGSTGNSADGGGS